MIFFLRKPFGTLKNNLTRELKYLVLIFVICFTSCEQKYNGKTRAEWQEYANQSGMPVILDGLKVYPEGKKKKKKKKKTQNTREYSNESQGNYEGERKSTKVICRNCNGAGDVEKICNYCDRDSDCEPSIGGGYRVFASSKACGDCEGIDRCSACSRCNGTGTKSSYCTVCSGSGRVEEYE